MSIAESILKMVALESIISELTSNMNNKNLKQQRETQVNGMMLPLKDDIHEDGDDRNLSDGAFVEGVHAAH